MLLQKFLIVLVYGIVLMLSSTYRFRHVDPRPGSLGGARGGYIFAIWHQNLMAGILAQTGYRHTVIISRSRDGDPVAYLCEKLGHHAVRGSSRKGHADKGGKEAKDEMIERLKAGSPGAVTVDGPSGPIYQPKPGIIEMARLAQVPIIPYATRPDRYWQLKSWDAFRLPKPFARIRVSYGAPIVVPASTTFDEFPSYQQKIRDALMDLEHADDARLIV